MKQAVARLLAVRDGAPLIEIGNDFSAPTDLDDAYGIADGLVLLLEARHGLVRGYKVGATSAGGQRQLGLAEPFYGRIPSGLIFGADQLGNFGATATVEAEVGFRMEADLPPRDAMYSIAEVESAIGAVLPVFEINRPAYAKPFEVGGLCLIADNGVTQALVLGNPMKYHGQSSSLQKEGVTLSVNGVAKEEGLGESILGNPMLSLHWLINALRGRNLGLRQGDVIASGALTRHLPMRPGDFIQAEYSTLGRLAVRIASA